MLGLSWGKMAASAVVQLAILLGLTFLFCFGTGIYVLQQVAGVVFTFGILYGILGLTIWVGRAVRFGLYTGGFRLPFPATEADDFNRDPWSRGWDLVVVENQMLIAWTAVGILMMLAAQLYYAGVNGGFPPDTIITLLINPNVNSQYIPSNIKAP